jgi:hypothetical protein
MGHLPSNHELQIVWNKIRRDSAGAKALRILKSAGFDLERIPAETGTHSGMIASIPFLPNKRARSRLQPQLPSARPVIRFLRELARATEDTYSNVEAHDKRNHILFGKFNDRIRPPRLEEAASFLEWVFSKRWVVIQHNPYKNAISWLRWYVIYYTGAPHDRELIDLLDAAFRAAGKGGFPLELETFKKLGFQDEDTDITGRRRLLGPRFEL